MNRRHFILGTLATSVVNAQETPSPPSFYTEPLGYSDFVRNWTSLAEATATRFNAGSGVYSDSYYGQLQNGSTFYGPGDNLYQHEQWAIRTGNTHTSLTTGRDEAISAYLERYNRTGPFTQSRIYSEPSVPYTAWANGLADATLADIEQEITAFNFNRCSEYNIGASEDPAGSYYGRYIARSRPIAHFAKALIYYEKAGGTRWIDQNAVNGESLRWVYDCMINHLYRWRNEFTNQDETIVVGAAGSTAPFMIGNTIEALRLCREYFIANEEDPEQYFPAQVLTGNYPSISFIPNPYRDTLHAIEDVLTWVGNSMDSPTIDTTPYPHTASYIRVTRAHTDTGGGGEAPRGDLIVGTPMIETGNSGHAMISYRSNNAYWARNIQMINVIGFWWMASLLEGETKDKYIEWGDKIFYGSVLRLNPISAVQQQKARNQSMIYVYEALEYRNIATGRND